MKKLIIPFLTVSILLFACKKDNANRRTCTSNNDGSISATIDNQQWSACEFKTAYYPQEDLISIVAIDESSNLEIRFYITIDSITPLKVYNINSNENNGIEIVQAINISNGNSWDLFVCDRQKPGIGGTFVLNNLDTISGKISATFSITGFSEYQNRNITVNNGVINNVKLTTHNIQYEDPSYLRAKINGVNWYTKQLSARVYLNIGGANNSFLSVEGQGYQRDLGYCQSYFDAHQAGSGRILFFYIPLSLGVGIYPLEPSNMFQQTISSQHFLFNFEHYDYDNRYYPITGSNILVTHLESINRKLDATFTTQAKDSLGNIFNFTSGEIHLTDWIPL